MPDLSDWAELHNLCLALTAFSEKESVLWVIHLVFLIRLDVARELWFKASGETEGENNKERQTENERVVPTKCTTEDEEEQRLNWILNESRGLIYVKDEH